MRTGGVLVAAGSLGLALVSAAPASAAPAQTRPLPAATGVNGTLALLPDGTLRAWGENDYGQLGDGTETRRKAPVRVKGPGGTGVLTGVVAVGSVSRTSLAVRSDGTVWAWGENNKGQVGDGTTTDRTTPVAVKGPGGTGVLGGVVAVSGGYEFSVALKADGTVWGWGANDDGQLGNGTTTNSAVPVQVKGLAGVVAVAGGVDGYHALALKADGTIWAWGDNYDGQIGNGTTVDAVLPTQVKGAGGAGVLTSMVAIAAGETHSLALRSDGTVWAWGYNGYGQLGDGTTDTRTTPDKVTDLGGAASAIGSGSSHSLAVRTDGTVHAWGNNGDGQLGDGTTSERTKPVRVRGINRGSGVSGVLGGRYHSVAVRSDGQIRSWGDNDYGQLGDGTDSESSAPVAPLDLPRSGLPALKVVTAAKVTGKAKLGKKLKVAAGSWALPATAVSYQWLRSGKAIAGATGTTYKVKKKDVRKKISVRVTAQRSGYPSSTTVTNAVKVKPVKKKATTR